MRGLCNGLGPAIFGFLFWVFHVNLGEAVGVGKSAVGLSPGHSSTANISVAPIIEVLYTLIKLL